MSAIAGLAASAGLAIAETPGSADQAAAVNREIIADSSSRTSLLQPSGTAGHDGKFFIASGDGNYRLNIGGQIQFRYIADFRDDQEGESADDNADTTIGFQTRRTKLDFTGNIINPDLTYRVLFSFSGTGDEAGSAGLEEAWGNYKFNDEWALKWGQFKVAYAWDELVSSKYQLVMERSMVTDWFSQDRSQGIQVAYKGEDIAFHGAFFDGMNSENTDITSSAEADWAFGARLDWKWGAGSDWSRFEDYTSWKGSDFAGRVGGAAYYQSGGDTNGTLDSQQFGLTADVQLEGDSWNAFLAGYWANVDPAVGEDVDDFGLVLQGGYMFTDNWELMGQLNGIFLDEETYDLSEDNMWWVSVGVNYYFLPESHAAKFTGDVVIGLSDATDQLAGLTSPVNGQSILNTGNGVLGDSDAGEVTLRFQMQLLF